MARTSAEPDVQVSRHTRAGWILTLLFVGNLLNFYDRQLPSIVLEQIKAEYALDDAQVGLLASAFVVVGAIAGIPLGMLADRYARKWVAGIGLLVWSAFTALGGVKGLGFGAFFWTRVGVGVGEASYGPATGSLISDLYPSDRRSRANAIFNMGFPVGLLLSFLTVGGIAEAFDSWRAPFLVAAVPGLVVAILILLIKEPARGQADRDEAARAEAERLAAPGAGASLPIGSAAATVGPDLTGDADAVGPAPIPPSPAAHRRALATVLRIKSMYGLIIGFAGYNFAAYAVGTFLTPVLQRYYGLDLVPAALTSGVVIGVTGLIGLLLGGRVLDRAARRSASRRVLTAAVFLVAAAVFSVIGLAAGQDSLWQLVLFLGLGYLFGIIYLAAYVPAVTDVVAPRSRSTAIGVVYAIALLLGGAGGPLVTGAVSDSINASRATDLASDVAAAQGLQAAMMIVVPIGFAVAALGTFLVARFADADRARMLAEEVSA
ncbi:MFS transporter [Cellulomonas sp. PhB143]|uniref:MFS transporter n=1 Tax=Cellulomonas sp. PhB143 TaxID=2485186 RepID=UPI000FACA581|nr:MFS transporter [Cellulomonas sp. PhB143]ROS78421.1 sugar phosphate permease [Cellulomonas sp. PhB143]